MMNKPGDGQACWCLSRDFLLHAHVLHHVVGDDDADEENELNNHGELGADLASTGGEEGDNDGELAVLSQTHANFLALRFTVFGAQGKEVVEDGFDDEYDS